MSKWRTISLGDVCLIERGGSPRPIDKFITDDENGINWIKIGDTDSSKYITKTAQKIIKEGMKKSRFVKAGDFLLSNSMSFGRPYILKIDGCIHDGWLVIRDEHNSFDKDYLYYCLSSPIMFAHFQSLAVGGVVNNLNSKMVREVEVPLPPLEEQRKIAANLDKATHLIDLCNAILEKLDLLVKARFVEMFDFDSTKWGTFGLDTDFVDYRGKTPEVSVEGTIRMVNAKSVGKGFFKYIDEFVTNEVYDEWMHRGFGYPGDVLFVTEGHTFGNTCLVPADLKKFALGQRVITIKGHSGVLLNSFLCSYMQTDVFWNDINVFRTGGTAQGIRSKDLVKVKLPLPPIELQEQFAAFVAQTDKTKTTVQQVLQKAETLKKALMQEYFG